MSLDFANPGTSIRIATVVVPVALYFLILGLLNSRPHPQMLRARRDFALLLIALCPLFALPVVWWAQSAYLGVALVSGAVGLAIALLAPPGPSWVIYNITPAEAARAVAGALRAAGLDFRREGRRFLLAPGQGAVHVSDFPLLRNVSVRMTHVSEDDRRRFEAALAVRMGSVAAETAPMAMALLLVAAAMLVAPLALIAPRAGEIVRILSGMLY